MIGTGRAGGQYGRLPDQRGPAHGYPPEDLASALSPILQMPRQQIMDALQIRLPYVLLAGRVSGEVAEAVRELPYYGVQIDPLPRRFYPQSELMCHTLGYVDFDGNGGAGIEGYYQRELAGEAASATSISRSCLSGKVCGPGRGRPGADH
jgi:cell division protein FtsI/penicillin-binding protein 2